MEPQQFEHILVAIQYNNVVLLQCLIHPKVIEKMVSK